MRLFDLIESKSGTFIGARFTKKSSESIIKWIRDIPNATPIEDLHVTIILSKTKSIPHVPTKFDDLVIDPKTMEFALFGPDEDILVLTFESPTLKRRHNRLKKKYNISWDFDDYKPHVTLAYGIKKIPDLKLPKFKMQLEKEYIEPFS